MQKELLYTELKKNYSTNDFDFRTTKEIKAFDGIVGQKRGEEAINLGLEIKTKGYNIYVSGESGLGKANFSKKFAKEKASTEKIPDDLCYVYNFELPKEPKKLYVSAGKGKTLQADMQNLINTFTDEIPKTYSSSEFEKKRMKILKKYQSTRDSIMKIIKNIATEKEFEAVFSQKGTYFLPIVDGETISEEDYALTSDEFKNEIQQIISEIQEAVFDYMRELRDIDEKLKIELEELEFSECLFVIVHYTGNLINKYLDNKEIIEYLNSVKEDVLDNLEDFYPKDTDDESFQSILPWYSKKDNEDDFNKYKVNLLVDNSDLKGAPVIVGYDSNYSSLMGEIEYDNEFGNLSTDFMKIKPGLLHKANGGYLILEAFDLLKNPYVWESLRKALLSERVTIEQIKEYSTGLSISSIKPESTDLNIKIILIGSEEHYIILDSYDEEFDEIFKIKADFDYEMDNSNQNVKELIGFIKKLIKKENLLEFDIEAIFKILETSERLSENKTKLITNFNLLLETIIESNAFAKIDSKNLVTKEYVDKAIKKSVYRGNMYEEKINEMLEKEVLMISTTGKKVGQINGLSVLSVDKYVFGKPAKITATTCLGKAGITDIENESEMSGNIHNKGVQVLTGYLGHKYAQDFPLSLSCRICFEQNYNGIDGDSASSAELYAIISSISNQPINQEIAVTGSINQFGEIQAIGGVNYKIEGFFDLCEKRGLTGNQGVIIPESNVENLVLKEEVIKAVKDGAFHIYPISNVDEGIELLMEVKAGKLNEKGKFSLSTVHGRVYKKLEKFHNISNKANE